nr:MerR family transcriptional regulator [Frankia sp. Cr2]
MSLGGLRTSELATAAGVNTQTLRYYERRGLLAEPVRTPGGHRLYPAEAVILLGVIKAAQRLGFTLDEVAELLDSGRRRRGAEPDPPRRLCRPCRARGRVLGAPPTTPRCRPCLDQPRRRHLRVRRRMLLLAPLRGSGAVGRLSVGPGETVGGYQVPGSRQWRRIRLNQRPPVTSRIAPVT